MAASYNTLSHGEIVSWDVPFNTKVMHSAILTALDAAGLDKKVARDMRPRDAMARACRKLAESRIIRRVSETTAEMRFQFTAEARDGDGFRYDREAVLVLDKVTGVVRSDAGDAAGVTLAAIAQRHIDEETDVRYTADIHRIVSALFNQHADWFGVRQGGGVYFVPNKFTAFLEKIELFLEGVGCGLRRYPVAAGTKSGDRSVKESVSDGMEWMLKGLTEAIDGFDANTRDSTLQKMVERVNAARFKVESYAEFLADTKADIDDQLATARQILRDKIAALGRSTDVPEPTGDEPAPTGDGVFSLVGADEEAA